MEKEIILTVERTKSGIIIKSDGIKAYELITVVQELEDKIEEFEKESTHDDSKMLDLLNGLFEAMNGDTSALEKIIEEHKDK